MSKQPLPVFEKPMIYYPFSVLMLAGIQDILIATPLVHLQCGSGGHMGIRIEYASQPKELARAFLIRKGIV
jgi:glucose-1-phosphate thymidylyltransferase